MNDRMTTAEYRRMIEAGTKPQAVRSNLENLQTGSRISSAAYRKSLSPDGWTDAMKAARQPSPPVVLAPALAAAEAFSPPPKMSRIASVTSSIHLARGTGMVVAGESVSMTWEGMSLLTLNEMLRANHRGGEMKNYRKACHAIVSETTLALTGRPTGVMFDAPVALRIRRRGKKLMDTDGLYAAFKFLIDGFRAAGYLRDDDPTTITQMFHEQTNGEPMIGIDIFRVDQGRFAKYNLQDQTINEQFHR